MQTERVTFLTTPDHKAALDAFASSNGMSVGHVVREAASQYIARPASIDEEEALLEALLPEVEAAIQEMTATIATMRADIQRTCAVVDAVLAGERDEQGAQRNQDSSHHQGAARCAGSRPGGPEHASVGTGDSPCRSARPGFPPGGRD